MKDSRSVTAIPKTKLETIREDMESVIVDNRYGKGLATKESLLAKIAAWRSELAES